MLVYQVPETLAQLTGRRLQGVHPVVDGRDAVPHHLWSRVLLEVACEGAWEHGVSEVSQSVPVCLFFFTEEEVRSVNMGSII